MSESWNPEDPELAAFTEGLVRAARAEAPGGGAYERALEALVVSSTLIGGATIGSALSAAPKSAGLSLGLSTALKWGAAGVAGVALAVGGAEYALTRGAPERAALTAGVLASSAPVAHRGGVPTPETLSEVVSVPSSRPHAPEQDRRPEPLPPSVSVDRAPRAKASDPLAAEVELLGQARAELMAKSPRRALAALDRYRSAWPEGRLGLEASVLTIEALMLDGQRARARTLGERFLAAHAETPFARRVRAILGTGGAPHDASR